MDRLLHLLLLLKNSHCLLQRDSIWIHILRQTGEGSRIPDIRTILTLSDHHFIALPVAQRTRQRIGKQRQRIIYGDGEDTLSLLHGNKLRFLCLAIAELYTRTILGDTRQDGFACLRMFANKACRHLTRRHLLNQRMEGLIELIYRLHPISLSRSDGVEALLGLRCKIVAEDRRELLHKKIVGNTTKIGRQQFA